MHHDVIVIGGGVAGLSAALFIARQGSDVLVLSQDLGGQLNLIPRLENYPGIILTSGELLARTLEQQVLTFGGKVRYERVERIDAMDGEFRVASNEREYTCKALVLALGKVPRELGLEGERRFLGRGLTYATKSEAPFYQGRVVATTGVGNYLVESALLLSRFARKIYVIYRTSKMAGDKEMIDALERKDNIEYVPNSEVIALDGNERLSSITVRDASGGTRRIEVDGLFVEMGYKIYTDFIKHLVKLNQRGEVEVNEYCETSYKGIFAAGDATSVPYKQVIVAAGEGAKAGISAYNYLQRLAGKPGIKADWRKSIGAQAYNF
ncbi:MAG: NAD(P)/FAD-dependent oxidoreductase [Candidatus Nitrosocaldus sp.]|nr:NAD(P)/FAD-dependent oxidoreductase [Candidatus Nitrosocaldus sp.]MCS7140662.1 NAD(P)/FAD-dependent oxidoreductase [Candidatus Nitrosocaldus sp.]MDW7999523.1 NAD(P)/FAD-dependent oxidoreductase [Candidatus Nitrosocaldus sp.]MDW8275111.1 NAD(P)/FAD-dependent oxidoreductase [Candidatus Nitrosocaldus sp.]